MLKKPIPNGTTVRVKSVFRCLGQICDCRDRFIGRSYDVVIIESEIFGKGEIQPIVEELLEVVE